MNAIIGVVVDARDSAETAVQAIAAPLPWFVKAPVAILVWVVAFMKSLVVDLFGLVATLAAVAFTAHAIFKQGKSGIELLQSWLHAAQQNLTGAQLMSAIVATGLATAVWLYRNRGTLGKMEHIVHSLGYMFGFSKEEPELADLRATAARLGYVLVPAGTADEYAGPMT